MHRAEYVLFALIVLLTTAWGILLWVYSAGHMPAWPMVIVSVVTGMAWALGLAAIPIRRLQERLETIEHIVAAAAWVRTRRQHRGG